MIKNHKEKKKPNKITLGLKLHAILENHKAPKRPMIAKRKYN